LDILNRMTTLTVDCNYYGTTNYVDYKRISRSAKDRKTEIHKGIDPLIKIRGGASMDGKRH